MLTGGQSRTFEVDDEAIVIAADLTSSDIALFDTVKILGLCTAHGGPTSHSVILAMALGIPAVIGLGPEILRVPEGRMVAIDGEEGIVWVDPEDPDSFRSRRAQWLQSRTGPSATVRKRASTVDGRKIRIVANISSLVEAERAVQLGADGVGELSMNPYSIPMIKEAVSQLDLRETSTLAAEALQLSDPRQVRRLVSQRLGAAFE